MPVRVLRMPMALIAVLIVTLCPPVPESGAVSAINRTFTELVDQADLIVLGQISRATARQLPEGAIVTDYELDLTRVIKSGSPLATPVVIRVLGGKIGDVEMVVADVPTFRQKDLVLLFVRGNMREAFPFVGVQQGVFRIGMTGWHGDQRVFSWRGQPVTGVSGGEVTIGAPLDQAAPMRLEDFVQAIKARLLP